MTTFRLTISRLRAAAAGVAAAAATACAVAFAGLSQGCAGSQPYVTVDGAMLGTTVHLAARTSLPAGVLYAELMRIDTLAKASMSVFDPASLLNRINDNTTDSLDEHIAYNIRLAERISRMSGGRYDITVKPLVEAWGFIRAEGIDNPDVDSILAFVGYDKIRIDDGRLTKSDPRVQIDLNSIAKGYTVDMAARMLEQHGIGDYIIEIGGEIRCRGVSPRGGDWAVGIDSPVDGNNDPGRSLHNRLALRDMSMATSGNYRRYHIDARGNKVAHTIDPRTGRSSLSRLLSVTVMRPECAEADALSTMLLAMGEHDATEFVRQADTLAVYFIMDDGKGGFETYCSTPVRRMIMD